MSGEIFPSFPRFVPVVDGHHGITSVSDSKSDKTGCLIRVVSYNILAQAYVKSSLFPHSPSPCLKWKARSQAVLAELRSLDADFLCIQELDEYESFYKRNMENLGYSSIYIQRSGKKRDGCGIFYKSSRVQLIMKETIEYNDLASSIEDEIHLRCAVGPRSASEPKHNSLPTVNKTSDAAQDINQNERGDPNDPYVRLKRDCVGILAAFRLLDDFQHLVVLANTHIYWDPEWADVKLAQAKYLLYRLAQFKAIVLERFNCEPAVVVAGDFNSTPGDKVYQFMLSGHDATSISGQSTSPLDLPDQSPIALKSLYAFVKEEPAFTNCTPGFTGTLDYIFFADTDHLKPVSTLQLPDPESSDVVEGLPNYKHPSDHLPIGADFEISGQA
ncbi:carbon catabolite repressor protein 4 homolog 4 isoform X2 [Nymphaea colorata]|nr:carbon catabolite repressor protein 4 homolog 4 isoform X2 [Nymphaea colorata]